MQSSVKCFPTANGFFLLVTVQKSHDLRVPHFISIMKSIICIHWQYFLRFINKKSVLFIERIRKSRINKPKSFWFENQTLGGMLIVISEGNFFLYAVGKSVATEFLSFLEDFRYLLISILLYFTYFHL